MSIVLMGSTSGSITLSEPAVAGTNTITLPAATGTMALTSSVVSSLNGQTGAITNTSTNTIGSYGTFATLAAGAVYNYGDTIAGSSLRRVIRTAPCSGTYITLATPLSSITPSTYANPSLSGTWRWMSGQILNQGDPGAGQDACAQGLLVRIS